ncbi:MAG: FtsQ-type POTRA domain-containing protein [Lentisphaerota bacterium]
MAKNNKVILKNPYFRISAVIIIICFLITLGFFSFRYVFETMFSENPRFRLRNIIVQSSGYWNNRADDVMRILELKKGVTNLFSINLYDLRKKLEDRRGDGIAFAEVSKELPDTIKFEIVERIPQAVLYSKKSGMVVDKDGVVMDSKYFKEVVDSMPVITGFKISENSKLKSDPYGQTLTNLKPALILISIINEDFNSMELRVVNLYSPNKLFVFMVGPDHRVIKVTLPFEYSVDAPPSGIELVESTKILKTKLEELKELLKYLKWKKTPFTEINMIYKDQAVVK